MISRDWLGQFHARYGSDGTSDLPVRTNVCIIYAVCNLIATDNHCRYVFDDYTWDKHGPVYSKFDDKRWIPSRIPLSAIISGMLPFDLRSQILLTQSTVLGPIVGGPFPDGDATPRAIAKAHWDKICPNPTLIDGEEVRRIHGPGATSVQIERAWLDYLSKIDDPCVEVPESSGNIFHIL